MSSGSLSRKITGTAPNTRHSLIGMHDRSSPRHPRKMVANQIDTPCALQLTSTVEPLAAHTGRRALERGRL
jgi:hypothetical protein